MKTASVSLRLRNARTLQGQNHKYRLRDQIGEGGSGLVYRAETMQQTREVAIKFFLPLFQLRLPLMNETQQQAVRDLQRFHQKELTCLQNIHHPNIVRLLDHGILPAKDADVTKSVMPHDIPFFVMEYVDGATLDTFLTEDKQVSQSDAVRLLLDIATTLVYLHEQKEYIHGDLRPSNILIDRSTRQPVLIDFAFFKNFNFNEVNRTEFTKLVGDQAVMPPEFKPNAPLQQVSEIQGTREALKTECLPGIDLYQFGKMLGLLVPSFSRILAPSDFEFYRLIENELCTWKTAKRSSARWLCEQLKKLDPSYSQFMGVEELCPSSGARRTIQIPGRVVTTSRLVDDVLSTRSFRRLNAMNQLLFVDLLYPGATHKRYLHSLRAYAYCADMIESLAQTPRFRLFVTPTVVRQALVLSLLHDINHFPLLHVFQEARGKYMTEFNILDFFCDGQATNDTPSIYQLIEQVGITRQMFSDFFYLPIYRLAALGFEPGLQIVKSMLDSGADIDKLAYLHDDSAFTGVAYGHGVDAPRLIASATVAPLPEQPDLWHLAFREEGLAAVESLIMARYWMFRSVYWHRTNRAVVAMLLHVIRAIYVLKEANAREFISETMWRGEDAVLTYLNGKFRALYGRDSIVENLSREPGSVFVRLFSVQGSSKDTRDSSLYSTLQQLDPSSLEEYRKALAVALGEYTRRTYGNRESFGDDDVLLDIPGRRLDEMGQIYIVLDSGQVKPISELTGPVQPVIGEFERIAKRLRVFVHPRVTRYMGPADIAAARNDILKLMEDCIPKSTTSLVK